MPWRVPTLPIGGDLSARLATVVPQGLSDREASSWRVAVESVTNQLEAFNNGESPDGWSTQTAASTASRICESDIASFSVTP
jgi:hypothetical protein